MHQGRPTRQLVITGLTSACLFGAATPASKALLDPLRPQVLAGLLYLGAAIGVLPMLLRESVFRWPWHAGRGTLQLLLGSVVLGGIIGPVLLLLGLRTASAGSVSLWLNLEFVATVLLGHFVFREQLSPRAWLAAGGTLVAAALLAGVKGGAGLPAALLVGAGCLCWGIDNHLTALIDGISPAQTTFWKGVVAGACNLIMGGAIAGSIGDMSAVLAALLVGAFSYGLSITLYITAAHGLGASRSQMLFSTAPFFALLLSVTLLGEPLSAAQVLAATMIAASLALLFSATHHHGHRHGSQSHQHRHRHDDGHHGHSHVELAADVAHVHHHEHEPLAHEHAHWPDLHHRHPHADDAAKKPSD